MQVAFYLAGEITQVKRVNTLGPLCLWQCFFVAFHPFAPVIRPPKRNSKKVYFWDTLQHTQSESQYKKKKLQKLVWVRVSPVEDDEQASGAERWGRAPRSSLEDPWANSLFPPRWQNFLYLKQIPYSHQNFSYPHQIVLIPLQESWQWLLHMNL